MQLVFNLIYFFGLQIVKIFTLSLLWIKLISGYPSAYGYQEQERIPLQHMRGQACISVCIPQPFLSHSPPVFPHLLDHVSVNISSPTCGSLPIYFLLAVGSLFRSVTGCTRGPVAYGLAQTALEKNHLAQAFTMGRDGVSYISGLKVRCARRGSCKGRIQCVPPAPPQTPLGDAKTIVLNPQVSQWASALSLHLWQQ